MNNRNKSKNAEDKQQSIQEKKSMKKEQVEIIAVRNSNITKDTKTEKESSATSMLSIQKGNKSILGIIFLSILFFFIVQNISVVWNSVKIIISLLFPFILGGAIAFILNVPMKQLETKLFKKSWKKAEGIKRIISYLITLIGLLVILFIALFVVIPELATTISNLIIQIPKAAEAIQENLVSFEAYWPMVEELSASINFDWDSIIENIIAMLQGVAAGIVSSTVSIITNIISGVMTFIIGFTFSIYVLFQKEKLAKQGKKLLFAFLPTKLAEKIVYIGKLSNMTFSNFLSGQCMEAVILGSAFFIVMTILKMPYAVLIGILISITSLIPIFGAFIGLLIGAFLIVMVNPMQALAFVIMFLVLQQLEGNLVYPYVVGDAVGLPSIWVLFAVTIGGKVMGIAGMLIFIPIFSVCYTLLREAVYHRIKIRKIPNDKFQ